MKIDKTSGQTNQLHDRFSVDQGSQYFFKRFWIKKMTDEGSIINGGSNCYWIISFYGTWSPSLGPILVLFTVKLNFWKKSKKFHEPLWRQVRIKSNKGSHKNCVFWGCVLISVRWVGTGLADFFPSAQRIFPFSNLNPFNPRRLKSDERKRRQFFNICCLRKGIQCKDQYEGCSFWKIIFPPRGGLGPKGCAV